MLASVSSPVKWAGGREGGPEIPCAPYGSLHSNRLCLPELSASPSPSLLGTILESWPLL